MNNRITFLKIIMFSTFILVIFVIAFILGWVRGANEERKHSLMVSQIIGDTNIQNLELLRKELIEEPDTFKSTFFEITESAKKIHPTIKAYVFSLHVYLKEKDKKFIKLLDETNDKLIRQDTKTVFPFSRSH